MGWVHGDDGAHEGYLLGLVRDTNARGSTCFRELRYPDDSHDGKPVQHVQVECSCGWRSPRLYAPLGTVWHPLVVCLPRFETERDEPSPLGREPFETRCRLLWREHVASAAALGFALVRE